MVVAGTGEWLGIPTEAEALYLGLSHLRKSGVRGETGGLMFIEKKDEKKVTFY